MTHDSRGGHPNRQTDQPVQTKPNQTKPTGWFGFVKYNKLIGLFLSNLIGLGWFMGCILSNYITQPKPTYLNILLIKLSEKTIKN